jgi:hypothetical protein
MRLISSERDLRAMSVAKKMPSVDGPRADDMSINACINWSATIVVDMNSN